MKTEGSSKLPKISFADWVNFYFIDHAIIRLLYNNFYKVAEGVYRSSHPHPWHFFRLKRLKIKTIINLRGGSNKNHFYVIEKKACLQHNIKMVDFSLSSSRLMSKEELLQCKKLFQEIEYPILFHCKSGADRAGLMATLYHMFVLNKEYKEANQLKWYFGHLRFWSTGVLDHFFEHWQAFKNKNPDVSFERWIENHYDKKHIENSFYVNRLGDWFAKKILRRE